jgi:hypothetical protein
LKDFLFYPLKRDFFLFECVLGIEILKVLLHKVLHGGTIWAG